MAEKAYVREQEVYLEFCRRWRACPKPTIAQVHKGCIAGGLMLAWVCDFIVASDDAFFQDPVVQMGFPGVTKQACNQIEDIQGKRIGMDAVFGYHHFAHANNSLVKGDYIAGFDGKKMAKSNKKKDKG